MLHLLDKLLQDLFTDNVPSLKLAPTATVDASQVSVSQPDETWRGTLSDPTKPGLNVCLVDLRENVKLRSLERAERQEGTKIRVRRPPYRLDCHYLISAYSPADQSVPMTPTVWEHQLLYEATAALARCRYLKASNMYPPGTSDYGAWPESMRDHELPIEVNPAAGFSKLAEFWGTMPGSSHPWRPVVYLIVTIPVEMVESRPVEMVRHTITDCGVSSNAETLEQIAGIVLDAAGASVSGAWVLLEDNNNKRLARTTSDNEGKFILPLIPGADVLYAAAFGLGQTARIQVLTDPPRSDYTLQFN